MRHPPRALPGRRVSRRALRGEEIPLLARIIAWRDVFDAMNHRSSYQNAFPVAEAVDRINQMKGKKLDPQVVEAFTRAYGEHEFDDILASRAGLGVAAAERDGR